jgi:cellulose synthase/poly-beta-1,6-N-acetylglucosamine synthase-like glycosyltransferase
LLSALVQTIGFLLCAYVVVLLLADLYLIAVHIRHAKREIARERATSVLGEHPFVCVQLPVFNEPALVVTAIDSLCALDWPRSRLQIMILDDSTDDTVGIAHSRAAHWRSQGVDIDHIRRSDRTEFKAGALAAAFERTEAPFIAVFDVDYRPAPSFLREAIAALNDAPRAAFVQARLDYRNADYNGLTRAQALQLDGFFAYEQAARNWAGVPMTFNGTCGVWRREAIAEAGGWSGRSLVEDQDLSFRAFARGWTCRNLVSVAVAGELPEKFSVLAVQRSRWGAGTAQAFNDLPWQLLKHLRWHQALVFILLAQFYASVWLVVLACLACAFVTYLLDPVAGTHLAAATAATIGLIVVAKSSGAILANRVVRRRTVRELLVDISRMWVLEAALLPVIGWALIRGHLLQNLPFRRTPKTGRS